MVDPEAVLRGAAFLMLWAAAPVMWHFLLRAAGIHWLRPTIPSVVISYTVIFQYLGIPLLYFGLDSYRREITGDQTILLELWGASSATITLLCLGFLAAKRTYGPLNSNQMAAFEPLRRHELLGVYVIGLICLTVLLRYITAVGVDNLAILAALGALEGVDPMVARSLMGNDFAGSYHWYQLFMRDLLHVVVMIMYIHHRLAPSRQTLIALIIGGLALLFSLTMAVEKAPLANFLISIILVNVWLDRSGWIDTRRLGVYAVLVLGVLTALYAAFMSAQDITTALTSVLSRTLTGQLEASYHYLAYFPEQHPFLFGRTLPNPGGIFPWTPFPLTVEIKNFVSPDLAALGIVGSMPTVFWGELYGNGGYLLVAVLTPVIGMILYLVNRIIFAVSRDAMILSFFVWAMLHYAQLSGTGISMFLVDEILVASVLLIGVVRTRLA